MLHFRRLAMKLFSRLIAVLFTAGGLAPSVQAAGIHFELHVVAGRLRFGAWYRQAPAFAPGDAGYGYDTGASKAVVVERPIPEPGAALVFGLGLLLTGAAVRRR
jgi:hypothetical protein